MFCDSHCSRWLFLCLFFALYLCVQFDEVLTRGKTTIFITAVKALGKRLLLFVTEMKVMIKLGAVSPTLPPGLISGPGHRADGDGGRLGLAFDCAQVTELFHLAKRGKNTRNESCI